MLRFFFLMFFLITNNSFSQEAEIKLNWLTNVEKAQKIAKKTKKPILVYFNGSDWCAPCIKLKEDFFHTEEFLEKSNQLVLVMIDKPRRIDIISEKQMIYNNEIIAKYNKGKKFPRMIILNSKGKVVDEMSGYSYYGDTTNHFAFINRNLN